PGEQCEDDGGAGLERIEQRYNSGQQTPGRSGKFGGEEMQIAVKKRGKVFRRLFDAMCSEHAARNAGVRATGNFDGREVIVDPEPLTEAATQRAFAGAAR